MVVLLCTVNQFYSKPSVRPTVHNDSNGLQLVCLVLNQLFTQILDFTVHTYSVSRINGCLG